MVMSVVVAPSLLHVCFPWLVPRSATFDEGGEADRQLLLYLSRVGWEPSGLADKPLLFVGNHDHGF